jgi:hypothetical protein
MHLRASVAEIVEDDGDQLARLKPLDAADYTVTFTADQ